MQNRTSYIPLQRAYDLIEDGDILLFRRPNRILSVGRLISLYTGQLHSHAALAYRDNGVISALEMREFVGCRIKAISEYISEGSVIDVYKPPKSLVVPYTLIPPIVDDGDNKPQLDYITLTFNDRVRKTIIDEAKSFLGKNYGYINIYHIFLGLFPFIRFFINKNDVNVRPKHMVCSTLVSYCYRRHFLDINSNINDSYVTPGDLAGSNGVVNYQMTISEL